MKHFDKQLNLYEKETEFKKVDTYLISFLILIGIAGVLFISNSASTPKFSRVSNLTAYVAADTPTIAENSAEAFIWKGELTTNSTIEVIISDFQHENDYELHLSNGDVTHPITATSAVTFDKKGDYELTLVTKENGKKAVSFSKQITIK